MNDQKYEVIIVGGGHNGLVAGAYLARAGKSVLILEARDEVGGATVSVKAFPDYEVKLSRYSYLISLLPDKIVYDLDLKIECISRDVSSYTPYSRGNKELGLFIARRWNQETSDSFDELDASGHEAMAWQDFYHEVAMFAERIAPTLLQPLQTRSALKEFINLPKVWEYLIERPIGEIIDSRFSNDIVKGIVLTDALIGTLSSANDLQANVCFLYHLIGNGSGEWKVPRGGMGSLVKELERVARESGVTIRTNSNVVRVSSDAQSTRVELASGEIFCSDYLLSNVAPQSLAKMRGTQPPESLDGSQIKINILLRSLPLLKSGIDPEKAFSGTLHLNESFSEFEFSYQEAMDQLIPSKIPFEMYCHSLTDPSILSPELQVSGFHTLTIFGLHTPSYLFEGKNELVKADLLRKVLNSLNKILVEPIEDYIVGMEIKSPVDIELELGMPKGNIFHKDLNFPFREDGQAPGWGVETDDPRIFICGAGAIRGGGVSGIPGHNAAMAILSL